MSAFDIKLIVSRRTGRISVRYPPLRAVPTPPARESGK
jgi:hypothetical protein